MKGVIDRFEGQYVVIEKDNGDIIDICKDEIPQDAKEGDVLNIDSTITIDYEETKEKRRNRKIDTRYMGRIVLMLIFQFSIIKY
ncbi:DUF3006 domain-containing protein [Haloimpatiens sp. FM7330]|uniref:DUF3006 domain-containing protein n=1 Tax=Haloimpatiens sp. FM7330 TaxID=3298610 RepID=UPI003627DB4E